MRSTLFFIVGSGLRPECTNPLTMWKLFKTVCIPRSLFGCELMTFSTRYGINMLEITYRFCVKHMQRINKRTKTNICLASLGPTNIEGFIDKAKLFPRRLCTAPIHTCVKSMFLNRLIHNQNNVSLANAGFIHDVIRIVNKYCLSNYIDLYLSEGYFVPNTIWKHIVDRTIRSHPYNQWSASMSNDLACKRFVSNHNSCNKPLLLWSATLRFPHKLCKLSFLVQLCVSTRTTTLSFISFVSVRK